MKNGVEYFSLYLAYVLHYIAYGKSEMFLNRTIAKQPEQQIRTENPIRIQNQKKIVVMMY